MDTRNDLIPLNAQPLTVLFDDADLMEKTLKAIEKAALSETADPTTEDGRKSTKALAHKVARSKTALDDEGKALADAARVKYDAINASRKIARDTLDVLKARVRKPVTDWEEAEKKRVMDLGVRLNELESLGFSYRAEGSGHLGQTIGRVEAIEIDDSWQEIKDDADAVKAAALKSLRSEYEAAKIDEAQKEELERLRAAEAERAAAEAEREREAKIAEREKAAAEDARKQAERDAADALEREKERAEREVADAEHRTAEAELRERQAADAERQRIADEMARERRIAEERASNDAHRARILGAVAEAIMKNSAGADLLRDDADLIARAIADGKIPHATINF